MSDSPSKVVPINPWRVWLNRGSRHLQDGDHRRASQAFDKALSEAPDEPQVLLAAGRERMRQRRFADAEPLLRRAERALPQSTTATALLARLWGLHLGQAKEAFELLERKRELVEEPEPLEVIRGELLVERGDFAAARIAFSRAVAHPGSEQAARVGLARTYNMEGIQLSEDGKCEPALFAFKRAADLDPLWSGPHVNMGVVLTRLGKNNKAIEAYTAALQRDPSNPVALYNLATAQQRAGLLEDAVGTLQELLERAPDYPHVRGALANVLGEMKAFDRSIALLLEELEIDPECASCWSSLGLAYICTGSSDRGEQCLQRALELDPEHFNALQNLAGYYVTQNRLDDAEALLRRAHQIDAPRTADILKHDRHFSSIRSTDPFRSLQ